jgi:RNA polymerase sigma factor (TIGR02999 family)
VKELTRILNAVDTGNTSEGDKLFPLAYQELRRLASRLMSNERVGQTLQPTALVHEAYLRLAGPDGEERQWNSRVHFFSAAAEAMRRILIETSRKKGAQKRGGDFVRETWNESKLGMGPPANEVLAVDEALQKLEQEDPGLARVVKLRYFAGMTVAETAAALELSPRTVNRQWECARVWLFCEISRSTDQGETSNTR